MLIVIKGTVKHDNEVYGRGSMLPKMPRPHELRLLDLGVCIEGGQAEAAIASIPKETSIPPGTTDLGVNLDTPPEGNDLGVNLDFDPNDAIQEKSSKAKK
jgi:hypothetical protein